MNAAEIIFRSFGFIMPAIDMDQGRKWEDLTFSPAAWAAVTSNRRHDVTRHRGATGEMR